MKSLVLAFENRARYRTDGVLVRRNIPGVLGPEIDGDNASQKLFPPYIKFIINTYENNRNISSAGRLYR